MNLIIPFTTILSLASAGIVYQVPANFYQTVEMQPERQAYSQHGRVAPEIMYQSHQLQGVENHGHQGYQTVQIIPSHEIQSHQEEDHNQAIQVAPSHVGQTHQMENHEAHHQSQRPQQSEGHQAFQFQSIQGHQSGHHGVRGQPGVDNHQSHQILEAAHHHSVGSGLQNIEHQGRGKFGEKTAKILTWTAETHGHNYRYGFETENGIKAQEVGTTQGKGTQAQGVYSYAGDDGHTYTVTYVADENGFRAEGAHLPTPPPIPEAIVRSLEKNARDEAAGVSDDGSYKHQEDPQTEEHQQDNGYNGHQPSHHQGGQQQSYHQVQPGYHHQQQQQAYHQGQHHSYHQDQQQGYHQEGGHQQSYQGQDGYHQSVSYPRVTYEVSPAPVYDPHQ